MSDYFIWKNQRSTEYGVYVLTQPPPLVPQERSVQTKVPGRPGSLTTLEGEDVYEDLMLTAECYLRDSARIPEIAAWLKGGGDVTFGNRLGGHYRARVANQIPFETILRGRPNVTFSVNFRCGPFWYEDGVGNITLTQSTTTLNNPGSVYAEPVITVFGSGDISLMVNTTIVNLSGVSGSIVLDCELQEAYKNTTLLNDHMTGDFPVLTPGQNAVSWSGSVTSVVIAPRWRYL